MRSDPAKNSSTSRCAASYTFASSPTSFRMAWRTSPWTCHLPWSVQKGRSNRQYSRLITRTLPQLTFLHAASLASAPSNAVLSSNALAADFLSQIFPLNAFPPRPVYGPRFSSSSSSSTLVAGMCALALNCVRVLARAACLADGARTGATGRQSRDQPRRSTSFTRTFCRRMEYLGAVQELAPAVLVGAKGFEVASKGVGEAAPDARDEGDSRARKDETRERERGVLNALVAVRAMDDMDGGLCVCC